MCLVRKKMLAMLPYLDFLAIGAGKIRPKVRITDFLEFSVCDLISNSIFSMYPPAYRNYC